MHRKLLVHSLLITLLVAGLGGFAAAQGRVNRLERMRAALALSDSQVSQVRDLLKAHRQAAMPLRQDLRARNRALRDALKAPEPNATAVGQMVIARRPLQTQLRALNLQLRGNILAALTPEQQKRFRQLQNQRRGQRLSPNED